MNLYDILNPVELADALRDGHVRAQSHPTKPLTILNYTEKAQFERAWNKTTLTCRGLIVHQDHPTVLARPFPKFFNHDEPEAADIGRTGPVTVTDKLDGSLGILYHDGDDWAVATRGSFNSVQARHATELYRHHYADRWRPDPALTYLFEIVFPANRIVVDYGEVDDLFLLGAVTIESGQTWEPDLIEYANGWPGPVTEVFDYDTLEQALTAPPRSNAEGYVIHFLATDARVKVKQEDYKALHRIVTGWNERTIWELLKTDHDPIRGIIDSLPDEFHAWATSVINDLESAHNTVHLEAVRGRTLDHPTPLDKATDEEWEPYEHVKGLPWAVIVDIDGTIAKCGDRDIYDGTKAHLDTPHEDVIDLILSYIADGNRDVIFMTGRDEEHRDVTREWLTLWFGWPDAPLHMRPAGDKRRDDIVKHELFNQHIRGRHNVTAVFDDRNQVVDMWRGMGLRCYQVAPGNF